MPSVTPPPINQIHTWTVHVATLMASRSERDHRRRWRYAAARPRLAHPAAGHRHLGNGDYLVEGMKFQMGGWWVVDFTIDANGQPDTFASTCHSEVEDLESQLAADRSVCLLVGSWCARVGLPRYWPPGRSG